MKKLVFFNILLLPILLFAQSNSWDGQGIKPNSKFRALNIFVNVIYDVNPNYNANFPSTGAWPQAYNEGVNSEAIPNYLLGFMDTIYTFQNKGIITRQFGEASFDALQIIGDFVVVNVKESRVLSFPIVNNESCTNTSFCYSNIAKAAIQLINETGGLQTLYGRNKIADYDYENKNQIYFAQTMIRNITREYGGLSGGTSGQHFGTQKIKIGNSVYSFNKGTTQDIGSGDRSLSIPSIVSHELAHYLLGNSDFHASGGNHRGSGFLHMPFLTRQGGHGLMGGAVSSLVSCNGYERWRMHWKHPNAPNYITARSISNSSYVISDIKKEDGNKSFILRDFVTYGDVVRIKLPYKDSPNASNQYIWLENHQIGKFGKLDFLTYSNSSNSCRPAGMPGIYAYYQVGRDVLTGASSDVWSSHERDNLKMISAEGYWDFSRFEEQYKLNCVNYEWQNYSVKREDANPFCGYQDQECQIHPFTNDNIIQLNHELNEVLRKRINNTPIDSLVVLGDNRDAFSIYSKINMSTNPSTCNTKAYYNYLTSSGTSNYTSQSRRNNETTYLTGLSVEMIPQSNNTFLVNIRWDDYDITNSANWTGKIVLKEMAILKKGNTIHLKQNKTPAQFTRDATSGYFAKTSLFICESNSEFFQEQNSSFIVDEKSKILLKSGSSYTIYPGADLTIKSGCTLEVEDCATLDIKGKLIVENGAIINFHSNSAIIIDSLSKIVYPGNVSLLIYPYVWINPIVTGNIILSQPITFNNSLIINTGSTLTVTSSIEMGANCSITIHPGAKLIVDGGTLTNACPDKKWYGILVGGNINLPQNEQNQGTLELYDAVIENARNAICTHEFKPNGTVNYNTTGGIIKAENSTFKNNWRSVEFLKYPSDNTNPVLKNLSYFKNCKFIIDDNTLLPNNTLAHITMWGVNGVTIQGCEFENSMPTIYDNRGAIYTEDAGYIVDEYCAQYNVDCTCKNKPKASLFSGYNNAIKSVNSEKQYAIKIDRSVFQNNINGIALAATNSLQISRLNMSLATSYTNSPKGIFLDECTGYTVAENDISSNGSDNSTGIQVHRPGSDENKIYNNYIHQTKYALTATAPIDNRGSKVSLTGLQFLGNDLYNNIYDISVIFPGYVRASQGKSTSGADNLFSAGSTVISNFATPNVLQFIDYYYDYSVARKEPVLRSSSVTLFPTKGNVIFTALCNMGLIIHDKGESSESPLAEYRELNQKYAEMMRVFHAKGYDKVLDDYYHGIIENENLLQEAKSYQEEIMTLTEYMADISNRTLFALKMDSVIDLFQLRDWYDEIYTLNAKYSLAETYYQLGKFEEGLNTLVFIPKMYNLTETEMIEHENYVSLFTFKNKIRESGRTIAELTKDEINQLLYIAKTSHGLSSVMAQGILCFFYDICFEDEGEKQYAASGMQKAESSEEKSPSSIKNSLLDRITLYPNPTTGELTITNYELEINSVEVFDVYGRKLKAESRRQNVVDISDLAAGIYFVKISTEAGDVVKKVVKQ